MIKVTPDDGALDYSEGLHMGYRAWLQHHTPPAYWFGHGLGYTDIALTAVDPVKPLTAGDTATITVTVTVENRGAREGKQVVQIYAEKPDSTIERPARWLVGFTAIHVPAASTATVDIAVPTRLMAHWADGWHYETGT